MATSGTESGSTSSIDPADTGIPGSSTGAPAPTTGSVPTGSDPTTGSEATSGESTTSSVDPPTGGGMTTGSGSTTGDESSTGGEASTGGESTGADVEPWAQKKCPVIYAQELLPTFELELSENELEEIEAEWLLADDSDIPQHPLKSFRWEDIVIKNASIRLRGNSSHWLEQGKMQFEISFNKMDEKGRFVGLKHVIFDAATFNWSFMRDRLALSIMRDVGLQAPCANNARIMLNGKYYGLFTNIEKVDSEFLERTFENPDGNLYKRVGGGNGWERKNNEEDKDTSDVKSLVAASDLAELVAVMNLDQAVLEWATEAVIPDRDGAWAGGLNLYMYNDPITGFNVVPWDLDDSFTRLPFDTDPYLFKKEPLVFHGRPYYDLAMAHPAWFKKYIDTLDFVVTKGFDVAVLQDRIDTWAEQIATAAKEDPNRPFTNEQHKSRVKEKRNFVAKRAAYLKKWIACWKDGGTDKNKDGVCEPA